MSIHRFPHALAFKSVGDGKPLCCVPSNVLSSSPQTGMPSRSYDEWVSSTATFSSSNSADVKTALTDKKVHVIFAESDARRVTGSQVNQKHPIQTAT